MKSTTKGIFLHRISYSETSLVVDFYTEEFGRKSFLFKGGKKKAHALFPMAICELEYYGRKESSLLNVTSVHNVGKSRFHTDPVKSVVSFFMGEVVRKSFREEGSDNRIFQFLNDAVEELNETDNLAIFPIKFLIDLSEVIGIQPYIEEEKLNYPYFDLEEGIIRNGAFQSNFEGESSSIQLIASLIQQAKLDSTQNREIRETALDVMLKYYSIHLPNFDELVCYDVVKEVLRA